jgi:hypothetical protein
VIPTSKVHFTVAVHWQGANFPWSIPFLFKIWFHEHVKVPFQQRNQFNFLISFCKKPASSVKKQQHMLKAFLNFFLVKKWELPVILRSSPDLKPLCCTALGWTYRQSTIWYNIDKTQLSLITLIVIPVFLQILSSSLFCCYLLKGKYIFILIMTVVLS